MAGEDNSRSIDEIEEEQRKRSDKKDDLLSKKEKYIAEESQLIKKSNQLNVQVSTDTASFAFSKNID